MNNILPSVQDISNYLFKLEITINVFKKKKIIEVTRLQGTFVDREIVCSYISKQQDKW